MSIGLHGPSICTIFCLSSVTQRAVQDMSVFVLDPVMEAHREYVVTRAEECDEPETEDAGNLDLRFPPRNIRIEYFLLKHGMKVHECGS